MRSGGSKKIMELYKTPNIIDIRTKWSEWLRHMVGIDQTRIATEIF
jgi:hypothetical protein